MLDEALKLLAQGWSIVPGHTLNDMGMCSCRQEDCDRPGKHPRVRWSEFQTRQPTPNEVRYWWNRGKENPDPSINWSTSSIIGITGAISGRVGVDVDPRHGGDEAWREWTATHPIPPTPVSLTGGGGVHLIFAHPGQEVRNTIDMLPGVDFRGDGGYLVLPPSRHSSGREYAWDTSSHPDDVPPAPMPPALLMLVLRQSASPDNGDGIRRIAINVEEYVTGGKKIEDGARNDTLTRICGVFAKDISSRHELLMIMQMVNNSACRTPLPDRELGRIVASIYRREASRADRDSAIAVRNLAATVGEEATPLMVATALWQGLGVKQVTDWYQLQGDHLEYVLVTPEDELRFSDLMDYEAIRHLLLNHLGVLAPKERGAQTIEQRAQLLRNCAREVPVEGRTAEDRVADWVASYVAKVGDRQVAAEEIMEALNMGPVWVEGVLHLRVNRFATFVETQFGEHVAVADMRKLLTRAGWKPNGHLRAYKRVGEENEE